MINYDDVTKENIKRNNLNWPRIPDHPYKILMIGGSGSGKINSLLNLIVLLKCIYLSEYLFLI